VRHLDACGSIRSAASLWNALKSLKTLLTSWLVYASRRIMRVTKRTQIAQGVRNCADWDLTLEQVREASVGEIAARETRASLHPYLTYHSPPCSTRSSGAPKSMGMSSMSGNWCAMPLWQSMQV
jgi:hypothetical protein